MLKIKQLSGFQATDGAVFDNILDARKYQAGLDLEELWKEAGIPSEVLRWLLTSWDTIEKLMYARQTGFDPAQREER